MIQVDWKAVYADTIISKRKVKMWDWETSDTITEVVEKQTNKKFDTPILPIPWSKDFNENIKLTLEWLIRDHRKPKLRLSEEPLLAFVRENWFHNEYLPDTMTHVCFPTDLLKYRTQYDKMFSDYKRLASTQMSSNVITYRNKCKDLLWVQWKCFGGDGVFDPQTRKINYNYACRRCCEPMPKGVKMYVKLRQSKLNEI